MLPADERRGPFGPDVSRSAGYPEMGYRDGDYRSAAPQAPPPAPAPAQGQHPYAAFSASGYGDDGYSAPDYEGPAAQDAGLPGPRTVRGFLEPGQAPQGYPAAGYGQPAPGQRPGWDYGQPLRYDDEVAYPPARGGQPAAYNGSEHSRPGIDGAGYDLSGIIGTGDFEAFGYDEPSYDRLSYDDPRYDDAPRSGDPRSGRRAPRSPNTRTDLPRYDETALDNLWLPGHDARQDAASAGYGNGRYAGGPVRSGYSDLDLGDQDYRFDETRLDMSAAAVLEMDHTRFDVPAFDETRLDRRTGVLLAPPAGQPRNWVEDTTFDHFADLDLTDEPVPAAFTRTLDRPQADDDTAARRAIGKRRGRSGDRRHWMALGAIAVVAAGAIGGVLMKYVFTGPGGPSHEIVAAATVDGFTRSASLEKQMNVGTLAESWTKSSSGSVSDVKTAVYEMGSTTPGAGSDAQIFMFVGGKLAGANPASSVANFEQAYPAAKAVAAGPLGGDAVCTEAVLHHESVSMCVWFDNDTFGALVSPTMTTAKLATTMDHVRPSVERYSASK